MTVYLVTNTVNGKVYVGKTTTTLKRRWICHLSSAFKNPASKSLLSRAIRRYGPEAFTITEICGAETGTELNQLERFHIARLHSHPPADGLGYNRTPGGDGGPPWSEEHRQKWLKAMRGKLVGPKNPMFGKGLRGPANGMFGRHIPHTEEWKKQLADRRKGVDNPFYGRRHSVETRRRMSAKQSGAANPAFGQHRSSIVRKSWATRKAKLRLSVYTQPSLLQSREEVPNL
jgi:group I intron endonuclease